MFDFTFEIARIPISVHCQFESTKEYFKLYLSERPYIHSISVSLTDLEIEQEYLNQEADEENLRRRIFREPFLERSFIMRQTAKICLANNILLLHGSTVVTENAGYLFTADCGVGKSTHTRYWQALLGDNAYILNDDRAFLLLDQGKIYAFGSPWTGKHGLGVNQTVPLAGICVLQRGLENSICRIAAKEAAIMMGKQFFIPYESDTEEVRSKADSFLSNAILRKMSCTNSIHAAELAYNRMKSAYKKETLHQ